MCCTQHHPLSEYRFGLLNSTGGGMPIFVFIVRRFLGGSGISFTTRSGLELMIDSTSVISVTIPQVTVFLTIFLKGILQSKFGIPILLPYKGLLMGWCVTKSILQVSLVERFSSSGISSLSMLFSIHCLHQQNLNHCLTILNRLNLSLTWIYSRLGWRNRQQVNWCQCALHGSRKGETGEKGSIKFDFWSTFFNLTSANIFTLQYVNGAASASFFVVNVSSFDVPFSLLICSMWGIFILDIATITLTFTIYVPLVVKWFKVIPLGPCAALWWLHQMIIFELLHLFAWMTGWLLSIDKLDLFNLPPTRRIPLMSRY